MSLTHNELIVEAVKWLEQVGRCKLILKESQGFVEHPDVIGFTNVTSITVEAKASRSDYLRDKKKFSRKDSDHAYGQHRYYICEPGTITIPDLPDKWGLLYTSHHGITIVKKAQTFKYNYEMLWRERCLLVSEFGKYQTKGLSKSRKAW
jgi:hypothetical protein